MPALRRSRPAPRWAAGLAAGAATIVLASGCADFSAQATPNSWQSAPALSPENPPNPGPPGQAGANGNPNPNQPPTAGTVPPPKGCQDFNPSVIATCLNSISAVVALPGTDSDPVGLAAERTTGRIMRVHKGDQPSVFATVPVDAASDGGLTGLALSPTYAQDQLIFAFVTTPTDNRVVRIAPGDVPKPVLTGIPRGPSDNRGQLALDHHGALLVATGDAGNPTAAKDPASLAGKVLRIDVNGAPAPGDPTPGSSVVASGLAAPAALCSTMDGARAWVADRMSTQDVLYRLVPGQPLGSPAWTWPDRPGVAGCAAFSTSVMVGTSIAGNVQSLALNADGSFTGTPQIGMAGSQGFGRIGAINEINDRIALAGTVNKDGGTPTSSDDRVFVIVSQPAGGGQD